MREKPERRTGFEHMRRLMQKAKSVVSCLSKNLRAIGSCMGGARPEDRQREEYHIHLSGLLDSVASGIISLDGKGRIMVFNAAAVSLFNIPAPLVRGMQFGDAGRLLRTEDRTLYALWERLSDAVWAAGAALDLEYDVVQHDGQKRVITYSVFPLGRTAWSLDKGVVIMLYDVTRKKEIEDQLSDDRKRLQAVFDGITDGIHVVDREFRVVAVNKSMTGLFEKIVRIGRHCHDACMFGAKRGVDCPAEETFRTGLPSSITRRLPAHSPRKGSEGRARIVEISTFPVLDRANRVVQVVEYVKDMTEKVDFAERLEHARRLAEIGEMAARVAHEVRNPLNAITGAAHFLSTEYPADETVKKFTDLIKRQSIRVNQVASDLLHASKPIRLNRTNVSVNAVLGQLLGSVRDTMNEQGVILVNDFEIKLPMIHADELQIEQALHNILINAVEAMPDGGTLCVSTSAAAGSGCVEIRIEDSGQGISEDDRERIFDAFYTTKTNGTGLGLSIVQGVLKNHGGRISIEQPETGGTRVVVSLPSQTDVSAVKSGVRTQLLSAKAAPAAATLSRNSVKQK